MKYVVYNSSLNGEESAEFDNNLAEALNFCLVTNGVIECFNDDGALVGYASAEEGEFTEDGERA